MSVECASEGMTSPSATSGATATVVAGVSAMGKLLDVVAEEVTGCVESVVSAGSAITCAPSRSIPHLLHPPIA